MDSFLINQGSDAVLAIPKNAPLSEVFTLFFESFVGLILVVTVFFIIFKFYKYTQSDSSGGKNEGKEGIVQGTTLLAALILVLGTFIYLFPNLFGFIDLPLLGSTSQTTANTTGRTNPVQGSSVLTPSKIVVLGGANSTKCANPQTFLESQKSGVQVCSSTSCNKICQFEPSIRRLAVDEAQKAGINYRILLALICQESSGEVNPPPHKNDNGTFDCGLMQINSNGPCSSSILDPATNIRAGITLYQQKFSDASKYKYNGIAQEAMAFANYNCCGSEGSPNQPSNDCSMKNGFPYDMPKWACPINPGASKTNMCFVKDYSCSVLACIKNY